MKSLKAVKKEEWKHLLNENAPDVGYPTDEDPVLRLCVASGNFYSFLGMTANHHFFFLKKHPFCCQNIKGKELVLRLLCPCHFAYKRVQYKQAKVDFTTVNGQILKRGSFGSQADLKYYLCKGLGGI